MFTVDSPSISYTACLLEMNLHTNLYNVIIKQKPETVTFHNSDVMPTIRTTRKEQIQES
jgi:hypothetical protein